MKKKKITAWDYFALCTIMHHPGPSSFTHHGIQGMPCSFSSHKHYGGVGFGY